jgi:hypothetical protein
MQLQPRRSRCQIAPLPTLSQKTRRPICPVGIAAFRPARKRQRERDSETYKITGLDIRSKRAMFQKYEMICLGSSVLHYNSVSAAALPASNLPDRPEDFQKP